jgi:hypothetical protein
MKRDLLEETGTGIGLRLCALTAAAIVAGATATAVSGAVWTATPTLQATTAPAARTVPVPKGGGPSGGGDHDRAHCPGDDFGVQVGDSFGDPFGDCHWCCG